ncbi:unnamed protein product [Ectocarpus fasciculatus]
MPTSFKFLKGQRVRLSIGGADARHFHPIIPTPPGNPTATTGDAAAAATPGGNASTAVGGESNALTKRVLRVHTGGPFASGVSLPVPCRGGRDVVVAGRGPLRPGREEERRARARASNAGASPALPGRARSLPSIPTSLLSISGDGLLAEEEEEGGDVVRRHRSEGRLQEVTGTLAPLVEGAGGGGLFEA